jgi:hypothetical protein
VLVVGPAQHRDVASQSCPEQVAGVQCGHELSFA